MKVQPLFVLLLLGGAFITSGLAQEEKDSEASQVVAEGQGVAITLDDLQSAAAEKLEELKMQALQFEAKQEKERHQILESQLNTMVAQKLISREASEQGLSNQELLEKEVFSQTEKPTEEEIENFYQANQQRLQGSKEQLLPMIRHYLADERKDQGYQQFVEQLKAKYAVALHFEPLRVNIVTTGHPSHGPADAPVTIVEFSDFECPYCFALWDTIKNIRQNYPDRVRLVYRHFPLVNIHPQAQKAAEASLCADEQGKFWEMHDLMFGDQSGLSVEDLAQKAQSLGLDEATFEKCLTSAQFAERVRTDVKEGAIAGVTGTPALFINGRPLVGNVPYDQIAQIIDEELKKLQTQAR